MSSSLPRLAGLAVAAALAFTFTAHAQGPDQCPMHKGQAHGGGMARGHGAGPAAADDHAADMEVFHFLLDAGPKVRRTITRLPTGVDTLTESDDPAVAEKIRIHVASMYDRVKEGRPIHMRDPLFRAVFARASEIDFESQPTPKGVRVIETSKDPEVAALIQAHADVVSKFIANGRREAMTDHEVPAKRP